jgi:hypothetical protein
MAKKLDKPQSTPTKPLPMRIDEEGKQHCPVCDGSNVLVFDYNCTDTPCVFRFIKECKDCGNYSYIDKRV